MAILSFIIVVASCLAIIAATQNRPNTAKIPLSRELYDLYDKDSGETLHLRAIPDDFQLLQGEAPRPQRQHQSVLKPVAFTLFFCFAVYIALQPGVGKVLGSALSNVKVEPKGTVYAPVNSREKYAEKEQSEALNRHLYDEDAPRPSLTDSSSGKHQETLRVVTQIEYPKAILRFGIYADTSGVETLRDALHRSDIYALPVQDEYWACTFFNTISEAEKAQEAWAKKRNILEPMGVKPEALVIDRMCPAILLFKHQIKCGCSDEL